MPDVSVIEVYGSSWTEFTLSSNTTSVTGRYCTTDHADPSVIGTNYPIRVPTAGNGWNGSDYNYSYWKTHFLKITGWSASDTEIKNVRWYTDGSLGWGTGVDLWIAKSGSTYNWGLPSSQYAQATGTEGTTGNPFWDSTNGHPYYKNVANASSNAMTYTSNNPFWVMSGNSNKITGNGYSWGVVTQVRVGTNASHGTKDPETFTWVYDII